MKPAWLRTLVLALVAGFLGGAAADPFLWLEDVSGKRAMAWVRSQDARTLAVLRGDPHFNRYYAEALALGEARDRIPTPQIVNGQVYNFWQDARHVRGVWRKTTIADYAKQRPAWKTVIDVDALAKTSGQNWVWQGADCDSPGGRRCLIILSQGGEDASSVREFDLTSERFVPGGFALPRGKQSVVWASDDALLVAREWRPGEMTSSGYPYIVKRLVRGRPLSAAVEVARGKAADVGVDPFDLHDARGHRVLGIERHISFFADEQSLITTHGLRRIGVPLKSAFVALIDGRLLLRLEQPWRTGGTAFAQGALVSLDLAALVADPAHPRSTLVYTPGPRATLDAVAATRNDLVVVTYENVRARAATYTPVANGRWLRRPLRFPDDSTIEVVSTNDRGADAFVAVTGFLTPTTLWHLATDSGRSSIVKALAPRFDASRDRVEQHEAASKDGTRVPYFVVRPRAMRFDGSNPTVLYGYGGFAVSLTPSYSGVLGKLWLSRGGVYAVANIRGGGEFGPAWHDAGLKTHRQRVYDDFSAVAQDLIARKITSPRRLGIQGGSNGGLLMGVEFTQHPTLFHAVDIQVPLLDMLRFEQIQAGASWVGEYGSVSRPAERAFLAKISPYQALKAGVAYPEPFVWTTTKDDRVGPQHARKFAAKLAALGIPYLFYEVTEGGHGAGANIRERALTTALEYTYLTRQLMSPAR